MTINLTPRKCLAYRSPVQAFLSELAGRRNQVCDASALSLGILPRSHTPIVPPFFGGG